MKVLLIGGDERFIALEKILNQNNILCESIFLNPYHKTKDLSEKLNNFNTVILPIPFTRNEFLNSPFHPEKINYKYIISLLKSFSGKIIGGFNKDLEEELKKENINFINILKDEKFTLTNAIITAEGTIEKLIHESEKSLFESNVCITGYGRVSKALARRLDPMCKQLLIYNNPSINFIHAKIDNMKCKLLSELKNDAKNFDIIINTIPKLIIDKELLDLINKSILILDLASKPGGVDFTYAKVKNIKTIHYLGIPAKVSSFSSANAISDFLKETL